MIRWQIVEALEKLAPVECVFCGHVYDGGNDCSCPRCDEIEDAMLAEALAELEAARAESAAALNWSDYCISCGEKYGNPINCACVRGHQCTV